MVDSFKSEVSEEFTKAYVNLSECEKDKDIKEESASACDELVTSPLSTDRCVEEEDLAKKVLLYKKIFHDDEELLNLQVISIEAWLLIQRATFDIHVNEEPYHSIQIYANLKKMRFVRRVWGISESSGELQNMEDLRDLCIATFKKSAVCLGHLCPDLREHPNLAEVPYPFKRWISGSCLIRAHVHMTSARRGEGGLENWLILRTNNTDRLREMRTRGGSKIPKILWTSYVHGP